MGKNENLIRKILRIIEEKPYCSSSTISIKGFSSDCICAQIRLIFREHLIDAECNDMNNEEAIELHNLHLTLRGLKYLNNSLFPA